MAPAYEAEPQAGPSCLPKEANTLKELSDPEENGKSCFLSGEEYRQNQVKAGGEPSTQVGGGH